MFTRVVSGIVLNEDTVNRAIIVRIVAGTAALIAVVILAIWGLGGFSGLSINGAVALILGISVTMGLGTGLMALVFWSARSDYDEAVYRAGGSTPPPENGSRGR